ncbi:N-acetylglucosamine-6-phosphate deacetylase [Bacillus mesophilus]|uniref:N-acetylglucosamine-6-phosphate deacetylase n=1 Tax=Bacillus mesophilus TaxID=1808955 RepID=A0A6M0Q7W3_9BACI|nr:N-acetylglucosamine-6-phosphate deacetylase [Bacillus mesophilus]MBM7661756.1 N-acetylglucosamine-6-phosphate deacetylase [Bacillus mesophilus]NEY72414.1 N-acetylglucosamine-6-phosphate deacetylase [Bacillus mesophilus]
MSTILVKGGKIYQPEGIVENGSLLIEDETIREIGLNLVQQADEIIEIPEDYHIIPGIIDLHIHGAAGHDTMDATFEALQGISAYLPSEGITSYLPTTITQKNEAIEQALQNAATYTNNSGAEVLGIHLEGPFLSPKRAGAQPQEYMCDTDIELFRKWQELSGNTIKMVTLAPEQDPDFQLIQYMKKTGVIASIGHSDATYEVFAEAVKKGLSHATHFYNQMREMHHREPGVVGGVYLHDEITAELIVDGVHVAPEMVKLTAKLKDINTLILISDAMRAKGLEEGVYELGGQKVFVENGEARLEDGTLAGSILRMDDAIKNMMSYTGCSLQDVVKMASYNPAKRIGILDRKGSLETGQDADFVILNEQFEVVMTFCRGTLAYQQKN